MSKKAWTVAPLTGKYYGTGVEYDGEVMFKIWQPDHFASPFASEREIAKGWVPEDGHDHVEDCQSYALAETIVGHLNSIGFVIKE